MKKVKYREIIKVKDGKVTFRGERDNIIAEAVTILYALKEELSEEEYKTVIRLANKSREQLSDEAKRMRGEAEKMEEIRTNLSKEDVLHNMLELVGYLVEQEEEADEIEVKVKDLNMQFKAWRDETESED